MKLWKVLGVAGLAGVAATGAIIARDQRQRAQLSPDDIRARLHQRLDEAAETSDPPGPPSPPAGRRVRPASGSCARLRRNGRLRTRRG